MAGVILQMTWQQNHPQQRRRRGSPPLGLKNLGNTCYLNSVLQCLTYTPPLAQYCLSNQHSSLCKNLIANREKECPFCILERQIARSLSLEGSLVDTPSKIQKCITLFAEHFRWGRQEDAHEFLRYAIDACHNTCLKLLKKLSSSSSNGNGNVNRQEREAAAGPSTVMREIFGGALLSQVKCLSCKGESNKTDEIMDISLDLFQTNSLKDALGRFFQPELLDGNNKYNCSKCKKLSVAKKQMFVFQAPNVLVIQLKRFEGIHGGKINRNIEFEEVLVLSKFMCNKSQDLQPEYNLFGSIVHSGFSPESGHYYAYIKDPLGRWYCCNDAHVSLSSTQEVLSEKVYILFYLRNNQAPRSSKTGAPCHSKLADSGCNEGSPQQKPAELSKPPVFRPNRTSPSKNNVSTILKNGKISTNPQIKNNVSTILKNGKISTNPQIKSINFKNPEMIKVIANGNGKPEVHSNGAVEKNGDHKLYPAVKINTTYGNGSVEGVKDENKIDLSSTSKSCAGSMISSNVVENGGKQILQASNENGDSHLRKVATQGDNTTQHLTAVDRGLDNHQSKDVHTTNGSRTTTHKRKSDDIERDECLDVCTTVPCSLSRNDASCKTNNQCHGNRSHELETLKELLASEASSDLRSRGWYDKVHNFMRTRKKLCTQVTGSCPDDSELRKQLIVDAKKTFLSQIPESLKEHLIERLRLFSQGKPLLDA